MKVAQRPENHHRQSARYQPSAPIDTQLRRVGYISILQHILTGNEWLLRGTSGRCAIYVIALHEKHNKKNVIVIETRITRESGEAYRMHPREYTRRIKKKTGGGGVTQTEKKYTLGMSVAPYNIPSSSSFSPPLLPARARKRASRSERFSHGGKYAGRQIFDGIPFSTSDKWCTSPAERGGIRRFCHARGKESEERSTHIRGPSWFFFFFRRRDSAMGLSWKEITAGPREYNALRSRTSAVKKKKEKNSRPVC